MIFVCLGKINHYSSIYSFLNFQLVAAFAVPLCITFVEQKLLKKGKFSIDGLKAELLVSWSVNICTMYTHMRIGTEREAAMKSAITECIT